LKCNTRTLNNIPRTSNRLEGFHRFLNAVNDVSDINIRTVGKELVKIQQETELYLISILYDNEEGVGNKIDFIFRRYWDSRHIMTRHTFKRLHWLSSSRLKIKMI
jgi:hypothetical protein